jgi:hypothetical protein
VQKPEPPAEKIGDHRYRIGRVIVDTAARVAQVPCRVNMRRGVIEYLAVAADGKLHESVLKVEAEPLHVHVALMLLGLEPATRPRFQGDPELLPPAPEGSAGAGVEARVTWRQDGKQRSARLEEWAWDIPARRPMQPVAWRFTGVAPPGDGPTTAEQRSVVATYRDPDAVLNNPLPSGADDTVYKANERVVPPVGTAVMLELRPAAKSKTPGAATVLVFETRRNG